RAFRQVLAGDVDVALGSLLLLEQETDERALAGSRLPDDEDELALLDLDGDDLERRGPAAGHPRHVLKPDHGEVLGLIRGAEPARSLTAPLRNRNEAASVA